MVLVGVLHWLGIWCGGEGGPVDWKRKGGEEGGEDNSPGGATSCLPDILCGRGIALAAIPIIFLSIFLLFRIFPLAPHSLPRVLRRESEGNGERGGRAGKKNIKRKRPGKKGNRKEKKGEHTSSIPHRLPSRSTNRIAYILAQIANGTLDAFPDAGDRRINTLTCAGDRLARAAGEVLRGALHIAATDGAGGLLTRFGQVADGALAGLGDVFRCT